MPISDTTTPSARGKRRVARTARTTLALVCACAAGPLLAPLVAKATIGQSPRAELAPCSRSALRVTTSTNRHVYGPGQVVRMTVAVRNRSAASCPFAVGPTSPFLRVTNSRGAQVWNNCYSHGSPGPCAQFLAVKVVRPGATYVDTLTWDPTEGPYRIPEPAGEYRLTTSFEGTPGIYTANFRLRAGAPSSIQVTSADNGRSFSLRVGQSLSLALTGYSAATWTEPVSSNGAVLRLTTATSGQSATASFVAVAPGRSEVSATNNPRCYPECLPPSRLFVVNVTVSG